MKMHTVKNFSGSKNIIIENNQKALSITYGGTLDLYFSLYDKTQSNYFIITKENGLLYDLFNMLYEDIKNINIYDYNELPLYVNTYDEYLEYIEDIEYNKRRHVLFNSSNYNELFSDGVITWYSDETSYKVANIMKIKKLDEEFRLDFITQDYIEGYDREQNQNGLISVRIRNSGSRYDPFNMLFMKFFNMLQVVDDTCDINHQLTIGEYIYNRRKM